MVQTSKRILSLYMLFTACFMAILARIVYINFSTYATAGESQATRTVIVGTSRGKIYDRNGGLLVDESERLVAAVTPVVTAKSQLESVFQGEGLQEKIEKGYPFVASVKREINTELIKTFRVPLRYYEGSLACHTVGYTDYSSKGVSGIEKAYEGFLSEHSGKLSVTFEVDALGRVLAGMDKTVKDDNFNSKAGVVLTLDKDIQKIAETAMEESGIGGGCAVVMDADTQEILALASVPTFDRNNVESSLSDENSPLVNKALESYSAGSVFKSIIAAYALECGIGEELIYECKGTITVGDKEFSCPSGKAHGELDMSGALQNSCNLWFINLTDMLDREGLLNFCRDLGFGRSIALCDGMFTQTGLLPDEINLSIEGNRANFSFGQGDLLVTPLQLAKAYCTVATGFESEPRLIYGFADADGNIKEEKPGRRNRLLSESTAEKMRQMLYDVTEKGIATNARSEEVSLAGKTGTAESGVFTESGEQIYRTWYAGFWPYGNPKYVVVVMNEDGAGGNADCAPVAREIAESVCGLPVAAAEGSSDY